ncbi:uncharacterized protein LOC128553104 [Mercenaria mercenaria]|uniref:uncharacterized protein LOC128553104 n=1 Tax=Mercenaria mercenaria TaxID=6596 RepID=UPI00234F1A85|nr:uncharacterized protein LOC128553104 [Mercenaria mercenaria]
MRSTVNRSTGFSPNSTMLGRETTTPVDLMLCITSSKNHPPAIYVKELERNMIQAHETARKHLTENLCRNKRDYDLKVLQKEYQVWDAVHMLDMATVKGKTRKLGWDNVSDSLFRELVHDQYRLAVRQGNSGWIRDARYYSGLRFIGSPDWMEEALPEVSLGKSRSMHPGLGRH